MHQFIYAFYDKLVILHDVDPLMLLLKVADITENITLQCIIATEWRISHERRYRWSMRNFQDKAAASNCYSKVAFWAYNNAEFFII